MPILFRHPAGMPFNFATASTLSGRRSTIPTGVVQLNHLTPLISIFSSQPATKTAAIKPSPRDAPRAAAGFSHAIDPFQPRVCLLPPVHDGLPSAAFDLLTPVRLLASTCVLAYPLFTFASAHVGLLLESLVVLLQLLTSATILLPSDVTDAALIQHHVVVQGTWISHGRSNKK